MAFLLAIITGFATPSQTCVNTRLKQRVGSTYGSALISFIVGTTALFFVTLFVERNFHIFSEESIHAPFWIWIGGCLGVAFMTANIFLMPVLGSVQTAVFPIAGQIVMGMVIDHFGLFDAGQTPITPIRAIGAAAVLGGTILVTLGKSGNNDNVPSNNNTNTHPGNTTTIYSAAFLWACRIFGIGTGMLMAIQTAINGRLGVILHSSVKAALVSFTVGTISLLLINLFMRNKIHLRGSSGPKDCPEGENVGNNEVGTTKDPWWIWTGGLLGAILVLGCIIFTGIIGVGSTVLAIVIGITAGGVLIDQFGLLGAEKKAVTLKSAVGLIIMLIGAALVKLA